MQNPPPAPYAPEPVPPPPGPYPGEAPPIAPGHKQRKWLPMFAVLFAIVFLVAGGYVVAIFQFAGAHGRPVHAAPGVELTALSGWEDAPLRSGEARGTRLTRGSANLDVFGAEARGTALELLRDYANSVLEPSARQIRFSDRVLETRLASGLVGERVAYVATFRDKAAPVEGEVTAVVAGSGRGAVFDGWAPEGLLQFAALDIDAMIHRASVS